MKRRDEQPIVDPGMRSVVSGLASGMSLPKPVPDHRGRLWEIARANERGEYGGLSAGDLYVFLSGMWDVGQHDLVILERAARLACWRKP